MKYLFLALAFCAGAATAVQVPVNTELRRQLAHPMQATLVSFAVGMLAALVYCLTTCGPMPALANLRQAPWWIWCGGLLGAVYVWSSITLSPKIGMAAMLSMVIAGQMVMSLIIDHYGLWNARIFPTTLPRLIGSLLVIAGAAVMTTGK